MIPGLAIERGPITDAWASLAALAAARFDVAEAYFSLCERLYPGLDRRGQAAFLIGGVAYYAAAALAWFALRGESLPSLTGLAVRINDSADGLAYRLAGTGVAAADATAALETELSPLVQRLKAEMRIGERAQWRLVADSIAAAYQEVGRGLGCDAEARRQALSVIAAGPMANPQTGYHHLEIGGEARHYLKRGGCCRWYTADAGSYCATCVMRSPDEQIAELLARR